MGFRAVWVSERCWVCSAVGSQEEFLLKLRVSFCSQSSLAECAQAGGKRAEWAEGGSAWALCVAARRDGLVLAGTAGACRRLREDEKHTEYLILL